MPGRYFETGSVTAILPWSTRTITDVAHPTVFDSDAMSKTVSVVSAGESSS